MSKSQWEQRLQDIHRTDEPDKLRSVREMEQNRLAAEVSTSPVNAVVDRLNELHDALIARAVRLAENEMARLGLGAPPVPYTYMLYGSGGRSEQTLWSDQDSGLVYANPEDGDSDEEGCKRYFRRLSEIAVQNLISIGYPPCEGNVLASNPEWCLSIREWESKIGEWFSEPSWSNVRYLLIASDGRPVAGDLMLAVKLKDCFFNDLLKHPVIERRMLENTLRHKVLVGVFGQLLRERYGDDAGSLDIKYGAYIPMVNAFRLMAMQSGIRETSTLGRIAALQHTGVLALGEAEDASQAFSFFLRMRLLTTVVAEGGQWNGTGKIPLSQQTKELMIPLKKALKVGKKIQRKIQREMKVRFGGR